MEELKKESVGAEKVVSFAQTPAMQHPHWEDARSDIEMRFRDVPDLEKWAIDATSARLMGYPDREGVALSRLGDIAANDLKKIWERWGITPAERKG